jgi:hypothetical protein
VVVTDHTYNAADIEVIEFDAAVRRRPGIASARH